MQTILDQQHLLISPSSCNPFAASAGLIRSQSRRFGIPQIASYPVPRIAKPTEFIHGAHP